MKNNFPKEYKYTLGEEIVELSWQCLDIFIDANSLPNIEKKPKISELSAMFDKLKLRLRMCQEINVISKKQFVHIQTNFMREIGVMIGGWLRWSNPNQKNASEAAEKCSLNNFANNNKIPLTVIASD